MARPPARHSPCRNPLSTGKGDPAGPAPIEGSDTYTFAPAVSRSLTPAPPAAPAPIPTLAFDPSDVNLMFRYLRADLQQILKTVVETKPYAFAPQPLVFPDGPCKRPLKAKFLELYCGKTHMECYNFIQ